MKLCLELGCDRPAITGPRCPAHRRAWEASRRLRSTQRVSYNDPAYKQARASLLRGGPKCWLCGELGADSLDHVIPLSRGGTNALDNLRPAHLPCNIRKHNRPEGDR